MAIRNPTAGRSTDRTCSPWPTSVSLRWPSRVARTTSAGRKVGARSRGSITSSTIITSPPTSTTGIGTSRAPCRTRSCSCWWVCASPTRLPCPPGRPATSSRRRASLRRAVDRAASRLLRRVPRYVGFDEDTQQVLIELSSLRFVEEDVVRLLLRHRALVGAVARGQRVVDVADGHHARGQRDLRFLQRARVALARELLVMAVGDVRHPLQRARPGDLREEAVGVRDVRFDLAALALGERALADRQFDHLVLREERALLPGERPEEGSAGDVVQPIEGALGEHGGPVAGDDELEHPGQLPPPLRQPGVDLRQPMARLVGGRPEEDLDLLTLRLQLLLHVDGLEPAPQVLELERLGLVRLHQDVFADTDLAEIVQHRRIAQLLTLLRGERRAFPATRGLSGARQHVAETDREPRHSTRVTRGGRIPRLDRPHAGAHEPFEQLLDLVVQQRVVDRRRRLPAERGEQLLVLVGEGLPVELVQRLQDADDLALHRAHRHAEDVPRLVTRLLVD